MRFLDRLRPDVDITKLGVFAVPREGLTLAPGLDYQIMSFPVFLPNSRGVLSIAVVYIHRCADRKTGDQSTSGNDVEHGEFLSDARRRIVERDRITEDEDHGFGRPSRQSGSHQVGRSEERRVGKERRWRW